jgi:hypothetical protein
LALDEIQAPAALPSGKGYVSPLNKRLRSDALVTEKYFASSEFRTTTLKFTRP